MELLFVFFTEFPELLIRDVLKVTIGFHINGNSVFAFTVRGFVLLLFWIYHYQKKLLKNNYKCYQRIQFKNTYRYLIHIVNNKTILSRTFRFLTIYSLEGLLELYIVTHISLHLNYNILYFLQTVLADLCILKPEVWVGHNWVEPFFFSLFFIIKVKVKELISLSEHTLSVNALCAVLKRAELVTSYLQHIGREICVILLVILK